MLVALIVPIGQVVSTPAQQQSELEQRLHHVDNVIVIRSWRYVPASSNPF